MKTVQHINHRLLEGKQHAESVKLIAAIMSEFKEKTLRHSWMTILPLNNEENQEDSQEPDANPSAAEYHCYVFPGS